MLMTADNAVRLFAKLSAAVNEKMRERGKFERVWHYNLACYWADTERKLPSLFLSGNAVAGIGRLFELNVVADVEEFSNAFDIESNPLVVVSLTGVCHSSYLEVARQVIEAYDSAIESKARRFDNIASEIDALTRDDEDS